MADRTDRDPRHALEAIALLAHLYADEDGSLSIQDDPDADRGSLRELLLHIESRADAARPVDFDAKALALVSGAIDLLRCAEVDALDTPTPKAEKPISKAIRHLERAAWMLTPGAPRADAQVLRAVAKDIWPDDDREADLRRMVERIVGPVEWSAPLPRPSDILDGYSPADPKPAPRCVDTPDPAGPTPALLIPWPSAPTVGARYGDCDWSQIPGGTLALSPLGSVFVCDTGPVRMECWDFARGGDGYWYIPVQGASLPPDDATLIHIGDGTFPADYAGVRSIVEAWEAAHPEFDPDDPF